MPWIHTHCIDNGDRILVIVVCSWFSLRNRRAARERETRRWWSTQYCLLIVLVAIVLRALVRQVSYFIKHVYTLSTEWFQFIHCNVPHHERQTAYTRSFFHSRRKKVEKIVLTYKVEIIKIFEILLFRPFRLSFCPYSWIFRLNI